MKRTAATTAGNLAVRMVDGTGGWKVEWMVVTLVAKWAGPRVELKVVMRADPTVA